MMGFDSSKFLNAGLRPREEDVSVPELKDYFESGDSPVFRIRGLTGHEYGAAEETARNWKNYRSLLEKLLSPKTDEQAAAIASLVGIGDKQTPQEIIRCLAWLKCGCVNPVLDDDLASRLCSFFPAVFYRIAARINALTNMGHVPGKASASGESPESKVP